MLPEKIVHTQDKEVAIDFGLDLSVPGVEKVFEDVDNKYKNNPYIKLESMEQSVSYVTLDTGNTIPYSLLHGERVADEALVIFAPFSDCAPNSSAKDLFSYINNESVGKAKAAPNSWNQLTKSAVFADVLAAVDKDMPVITIFSPVPTSAYSSNEKKQFSEGDFSPAAKLVNQVLAAAQEKLHGRDSETQINKLHFYGASLGASNVIGSAYALRETAEIKTVTAQELIIGPNSIADLLGKFTVKGVVGESSDLILPLQTEFIAEPQIRQDIDSNGNELAMFGRMLGGMTKLPYLRGLTHPKNNKTLQHIEGLASRAPVLVALAENSGISKDTTKYLPETIDIVKVKSELGEKSAHIINEYVALSAVVMLLNIRRQK